MIQTIFVHSYPQMIDKLKELPEDARIIGCVDTYLVKDPLFETDDYKLSLSFDDCIPGDGSDYTPMSKEQAEQVVNFILKLMEGRVRYDLHVHCIAGRSRSAAIASFAAWVCRLEDKHIKTKNFFQPNSYVLNLLKEVYRTKITSGAF